MCKVPHSGDPATICFLSHVIGDDISTTHGVLHPLIQGGLGTDQGTGDLWHSPAWKILAWTTVEPLGTETYWHDMARTYLFFGQPCSDFREKNQWVFCIGFADFQISLSQHVNMEDPDLRLFHGNIDLFISHAVQKPYFLTSIASAATS